jgi:cell division protease FtsH
VIEEAHLRVREILSARRNVLDEVAHRLLQKEVVQGEELREILGKTPKE